jgi:hypothetical protein
MTFKDIVKFVVKFMMYFLKKGSAVRKGRNPTLQILLLAKAL